MSERKNIEGSVLDEVFGAHTGAATMSANASKDDRKPLYIEVPAKEYQRLKLTMVRSKKPLRELIVDELEAFDSEISKMAPAEAVTRIRQLTYSTAGFPSRRSSLLAPTKLIESIKEKAAIYMLPSKVIIQAALIWHSTNRDD